MVGLFFLYIHLLIDRGAFIFDGPKGFLQFVALIARLFDLGVKIGCELVRPRLQYPLLARLVHRQRHLLFQKDTEFVIELAEQRLVQRLAE